jgi:hypothetical protein
MDMELSVSNISYLSEPKSVRDDERRQPRRDQGKKKKKGGEEEKKEHKGLVDLTV